VEVVEFLISLVLFIWIATAVFWGLATLAIAGTFNLERSWLWAIGGALVPAIGFLICLIVGIAKRPPGKRVKTSAATKRFKLWFAAASALLILALLFAIFLPWFVVEDSNGPIYSVRGWSSGLDGWVWGTILTLAIGAVVTATRPNRIVSVALAWFGSWWLLYSVAALTSESAFRSAVDGLFNITDVILNDVDAPDIIGDERWSFIVGSVWGLMAVIGVALLAMSVWALRGFGKPGEVATDFWGASSSSAEDQRLI
jgi:uncharacterized membrane protein